MKIDLVRQECNSDCTLGALLVNGVYFCDTLEGADMQFIEQHPNKFKHCSNSMRSLAPLLGSYEIDLEWSDEYARLLPILRNVKYHPFCFVHKGFTWRDCNGSIIIGHWLDFWQVMSDSDKYLNRLCAKLRELKNNTFEPLKINIQWQK